MRRQLFIGLLLAGITLAIYWPARNYGIVYYDDPLFVTENAEINSGLNWHSLWWAFSGILIANWHPVTSLSFVLGHQSWGTNPGAEHLVNVAFHMANAVLLFLVLQRITGCPWRSAMVAAVFAWHPLRVESVAWISERKDVLSTFFFLLTLGAYVRYVQKRSRVESRESGAESSGLALDSRRWTLDYFLVLVFFALGLMSKPMLVTVPFVLLLLDFWPLRRISEFGFRSSELKNASHPSATLSSLTLARRRINPQLSTLLLEKWPFFLLSAVFSGLTYALQKTHAAVVQLSRLSLEERLGNAVTSYLQYLAKLFWPTKLAVIYPYPKSQDDAEIWLTALLLLAISAFCVCQFFRRPYLAVGWFWFLGTAVPIIGLVQVGEQAMADRYTYIPLIGPVISLVWLGAEFFQSRKFFLAAVSTVILAACIGLTTRQLQFWRDTVVLAGHNVAVTPQNASAYFLLGLGLEHAGETNRAIPCYRVATAIFPGNIEAHRNLAYLLRRQDHLAAAEEEYYTLLAMNPDDLAAQLGLADIFNHLGRPDKAAAHFNEALRIKPDSTEAMNNLAWTLATSPDTNVRDGKRAVELAERACELTHYQKTIYLGTLAAAYAEAGRFDDAIAMAQKACAMASESGEQDLLKRNQELLALYRAHKPYRETP
jgi:tetratricopeptide (TPR) repeat protein